MCLHRVVLVLLLFAFLFAGTWGGNILAIFHHPGYSHYKSFSPILLGLANRGHNMTVVTYFPAKNPPTNYHEIILKGHHPLNSYSLEFIKPTSAFRKGIGEFLFLQELGREACKTFFEANIVEQILKSHGRNPFHLVVTEAFNTDCMLGLVHFLQIPFVAMSSCVLMPWHYDRVGLPDFPSFIPAQFAGFDDEMSYSERVMSFIATKGVKLLYRTTERTDNEMIRKYLGIDVDVREIAKETSLMLVNQHYSVIGAGLLSNRVIEIGGAHVTDEMIPLSPDMKAFLDNSRNGVILLSWGSLVNVSSLPADKFNGMLKAFNKLNAEIIWKWDSDKKPSDSSQIFVTKWLPQKEVLCHPKVRLFWSHGGLLGTTESVHCATPMVITPMYGDQYLNARAIQKRKMGLILNYEDITEENVYNTISKALQPEFARNAKYISDVFRNRQNPPLETALWWIEHVLHTQGSNLTYSPSVEMNWFTYYSIDAILTLASALLIVLLIPVYCISKACALMKTRCSPCRPKSVQSVPKKKKTH